MPATVIVTGPVIALAGTVTTRLAWDQLVTEVVRLL
jgi:hypothetical protein